MTDAGHELYWKAEVTYSAPFPVRNSIDQERAQTFSIYSVFFDRFRSDSKSSGMTLKAVPCRMPFGSFSSPLISFQVTASLLSAAA